LGHVGGMGIDAEISKMFQRICVKQGLKFKLQTKVTSASRVGDKVRITVEGVKDGKTEEVIIMKFLIIFRTKQPPVLFETILKCAAY
jgi:pyruvate/2-oxoglutarate dehydrogenase complex dihydrolipoamide dehydrogenase (E3) component